MKRVVDVSEWSGILIYAEFQNQKIRPISLELIGEAYRLTEQSKQPIYVVGVGEQIECLKEQLKGYPIKAVYLYEVSGGFKSDSYAQIVSKCINEVMPSVVLIGGTSEGRAISPRLAVIYRTGLTADCTELCIDSAGNLVQTRPAFGGNIMASIVTQFTRPQFVTVREKVKLPIESLFSFNTIFNTEVIKNCDSKVEILDKEMLEGQEGIGESELLIVAGRGVEKKEDLEQLRELARLLGGSFACSRALVEKGWTTPNEQIGLSGNTVSPKCMIIFGVSGTVQFVAGMSNTKNIIAINSDMNARIFDIAHYPICANLYEVLPKLLELAYAKCL